MTDKAPLICKISIFAEFQAFSILGINFAGKMGQLPCLHPSGWATTLEVGEVIISKRHYA